MRERVDLLVVEQSINYFPFMEPGANARVRELEARLRESVYGDPKARAREEDALIEAFAKRWPQSPLLAELQGKNKKKARKGRKKSGGGSKGAGKGKSK